MNRNKLIERRQRFVEWTLPVHVVARELEKYNARPTWNGNPSNCTWPSTRWSTYKKPNNKAAIKLIIKFKRRERWEMFKAEHNELIRRIHFESLFINELPDGQSFNFERQPLTISV